MVAIKARDVARLLQNPDRTYQAFLLYGPEEGVVNDRARTLATVLAKRSEPPGTLLRIGERDLAERPEALAVEARTLPMFDGPKIIRVTASAKLKVDLLQELLNESLEARLIIEAGNLKPAAKLRKIFEKAAKAAALPCYFEGARDMATIIDEELTAHGFQVSREVAHYLASLLGSDLAIARSELQKLALYVGAGDQQDVRQPVTIAHINAIIGDSSAPALDELMAATLGGQPGQAMGQLERLLAQGTGCQTILILLLRHLNRLHQVQSQTARGMSLDQAMKTLKPPVFFKQTDSFKRQCQHWPLPALASALRLVRKAVLESRFRPELESELTAQLLLTLAARKGSPQSRSAPVRR